METDEKNNLTKSYVYLHLREILNGFYDVYYDILFVT
jgi:hypothetical protein